MPTIERELRRDHTKRRLTELENEVHDMAQRVDALLEAIGRVARQHYGSPLLPENSVSRSLQQARRR